MQRLPLPLMLEPAPTPKAMLKLPVVLFARELKPKAVLELPVVFSRSAPVPVAVLEMPVVLREQRTRTDSRVSHAGSVVI